MINWTVRIKNELFWLAIIPAVLVLIKSVAAVFGFELDFTVLDERLEAVVYAVFSVLSILGIVTDHTTAGVGDSEQALTYVKPRK